MTSETYVLVAVLLLLLRWHWRTRLRPGQLWLNAQTVTLYVIIRVTGKEGERRVTVVNLHTRKEEELSDWPFTHSFHRVRTT